MAYSTDAVIPKVWRFADIPQSLVTKLFACSGAEADRHLERLRKQHTDAAWVTETLTKLPAPSLAVLSILADYDGMLVEHDLYVYANHRFGLKRDEIQVAIDPLMRDLLVVPLQTSWSGHALALVEPAAHTIIDQVLDLDLPSISGAPLVPRSLHDGGRTLLAACAALRHVEIKLTQAGLPHRAGLKRLAKQLGLEEAVLDEVLLAGLAAQLLVEHPDNVVRPEFTRLDEAAHGRYAHAPRIDRLIARLGDHATPVPGELVTRWLLRASRATAQDGVDDHDDDDHVDRGDDDVVIARPSPLPLHVDHLGHLPHFVSGTVGEQAAFALSPPGGAPAASITPSFEVFLPPESRLADIVHVVACAELVRIDRVIVCRITKASVARAVATSSADELLAGLAAACRTPIPQNVAAAIGDWAAGTSHAVIATGRVIVVAAADQDRVFAALASLTPKILAPGVVLVPEDVPARIVNAALAKIGIHERAHGTGPRPRAVGPVGPARSARSAPSAPRVIPAVPAVDVAARLRDRMAAYRRGDPAERRLVPVHAATPSRTAEPDVDDLEVSAEVMQLLDAWERRQSVVLDEDDYFVCAAVLDVVAAHDRQFALAAPTLDVLLARVSKLFDRRALGGFSEKHRETLERVLPAARPTSERTPLPAGLAWQRDNVLARLQAAAKVHATVILDLGTMTRTMAVSRVIQRGAMWMALGEDPADATSFAMPLRMITGIAEAPPPTAPSAPGPWRPLDGQAPPPGHAACPCGSGRKYRNCCRTAQDGNHEN
jgi:hypothetical protein